VAIYNNDGLVIEKTNEEKRDTVEINLVHPVRKSEWIAAIVYCDNGAVAHTSPVYMIVDGKPTWSAEKGPAIIEKQLALIKKVEEEEKAQTPTDYGILERIEKAREFYKNMLSAMNGN
jgi:hypothetical protein